MANIILTCYLTERQDPQRRFFWWPNNDLAVEKWIASVERLGLHGIIFHDTLSEDFAQKWARANVAFRRIRWSTPWSALEERVRIYSNWLTQESGHFEKVLTTDLTDVEFYRDPFALMDDPGKLYIGSEPTLIGDCDYMKLRMLETYGEITNSDKQVLNPGILGGHYETVARFLCRWLEEMERSVVRVPPPPHDMSSINRLIYRENVQLITGAPLHTEFRKMEGPESGCCIRHK
jgi:hypothetical protein